MGSQWGHWIRLLHCMFYMYASYIIALYLYTFRFMREIRTLISVCWWSGNF